MRLRHFCILVVTVLSLSLVAAAAEPAHWSLVDRSYTWTPHPQGYGMPPERQPDDNTPVKLTNVVLENDYLTIEVAVQAAGRVMHVRYKNDGTEMFNVLDRMSGGQVWDGGGWRSSFPFQEHGMRYTEQPCGWRVIEGKDGSVTLTLDNRFERFISAPELGRYGRFTPLRLGRAITLRPDQAYFEVTEIVENPLPYRFGYRVWSTAQFPDAPDAEFWSPVSRVSDHGMRNIRDWTWHSGEALRANWDTYASLFSINAIYPFAGFYYPSQALNRLRIADPKVMPAAKYYLWDYPGVFFEMWTGSEHLFEQEGKLIPAFESRVHTERYYAVRGIGRVEYANENFATSTLRTPSRVGEHVCVRYYPVRNIDSVQYSVLSEDGTVLAQETAPALALQTHTLLARLPSADAPVRVLAKSGDQVLLDVSLPLAVPKPDPELEKQLMSTINPDRNDHERTAISYETRAWVNGRNANLASAALRAAMDWAEAEPSNVDAQRQLGRIQYMIGHFDKAAAALKAALAIDPDDAQSHMLMGLALWEQNQAAAARQHFTAAASDTSAAPEANYMLAMGSIAAGDRSSAIQELQTYVKADPKAVRPRIVLAALLAEQGELTQAHEIGDALTHDDPSSPEIAYVMTLSDPQEPARVQTLAKMLNDDPEAPQALEQLKAEIEHGHWVNPPRPDISNVVAEYPRMYRPRNRTTQPSTQPTAGAPAMPATPAAAAAGQRDMQSAMP